MSRLGHEEVRFDRGLASEPWTRGTISAFGAITTWLRDFRQICAAFQGCLLTLCVQGPRIFVQLASAICNSIVAPRSRLVVLGKSSFDQHRAEHARAAPHSDCWSLNPNIGICSAR